MMEVSKAPRLNPKISDVLDADDKSHSSLFDTAPFNVAVAYDGSLSSKAALKFASEYLMVRKTKNTHLDVVHVYSPDLQVQSELARPYKKETIEADLGPLDISLGKRFSCFYMSSQAAVRLHAMPEVTKQPTIAIGDDPDEIKMAEQSQVVTQQHLERAGSKEKMSDAMAGKKEGKLIVEWSFQREEKGSTIDFMFMGFSGKNTATETELLASDVSYTLQYLRCSTVVVKKDTHLPEITDENGNRKPLHVLVCVDMSPQSEKALFDAMALTTDEDKITMFHSRVLEEEGKTINETADSYYQTLMERVKADKYLNRNIEFVAVRHGGEGPGQDILDYVAKCEGEGSKPEDEVHMVCMGTDCRRLIENKSYLGSNAGRVICKINKPIVVAKYDSAFASVMTADEKMMAVPGFPSLY